MFTQGICLTHYSDDFILALEGLGYVKSEFSGTAEKTRDDLCICTSILEDTKDGPCYIILDKSVALSNDPTVSWVNKCAQRIVTDNENVAFGLASLQDSDTDKYQFFTLECNYQAIGTNSFMKEPMKKKGSLVFCTNEKWNVDVDKDGNPSLFSNRNIPAHKSTKEEIINYFSKNNKDEYVQNCSR